MLPVIFPQPVFRDLPYFIQCPEQIKIQYFGPVFQVKTFDKGILSRFTRFNKFQYYSMLFRSVCHYQWYKLRTIIHPHFHRVSACCNYSAQYPDNTLGRDIQINFYRQGFSIKIIHNIERPETPAADQRIMHKINRPALIQCLRRYQCCRITHR